MKELKRERRNILIHTDGCRVVLLKQKTGESGMETQNSFLLVLEYNSIRTCSRSMPLEKQ
jgi:hypothetical protein